MAQYFTEYAVLPSKENPFGITHEEMRSGKIKAGEELRRIVESAKNIQDIKDGVSTMSLRGFLEVPDHLVFRAYGDLNARLLKEAEQRRAVAKISVSKRIKSSIRLAMAARKATRNHVRGWA